MLRFKQFKLQESKDSMTGVIGEKGRRHLINYVAPYLSKDQRHHLHKNFSDHKLNLKTNEDGHLHKPENHHTTHELGSEFNGHKSGTKVKLTGAHLGDGGKIIAHTANHGEIPLSKINKPTSIKKPQITKGGFDVESKIAKNLGVKAAGATGTAYDFAYGGDSGIKGKVRKLHEKGSTGTVPIFRGESKQNKANMGVSSLKFDHGTKKWGFTNKGLSEHFSKAVHPESGKPILEHLNEHNKNGRIEKGFTTHAPTGMTHAYIKNIGVNALHLHRTEGKSAKKEAIDRGTTYTVGEHHDLNGKTRLAHLSPHHLNELDGRVKVESTTTGTTRIAHVPDTHKFKELADNSHHYPDKHGDLTNEEHSKHFRTAVDAHLKSMKKK